MIKTIPFFYSSPPKAAKECDAKGKEKSKSFSSTSSDSEADSLSLDLSTEEVQTKGDMKTGDSRQDSALQSSPVEIRGTDPSGARERKKQKQKGLRKKIAHAFFDMAGGKSREKNKQKDPLKEERRPVTADQIRELIKQQHFAEASQHLLLMEKGSNCDSVDQSEEKKVDDGNEIEDLFEFLKQEVFAVLQSSLAIAPFQPELVQDAVRALIEQVKEDERCGLEEETCETAGRSCSRNWKVAWGKTVRMSVNQRMTNIPPVGNEDMCTIAHNFLHMGNTMKEDLITVVQYIEQYYPEHFKVCNTYAKFYHYYFSSQLKTIAQFELSNQDTYLLLTWVQNIYPNQIRQHPLLAKDLNDASFESLLPSREIKQLEATYRANKVDSVKSLLTECLRVEATRWKNGLEPEKLNSHFHSELPIDVIQAIYGAQKHAESITPELGKQISALLLTELANFLQSYKKELYIFIKDSKQHQYFEATIIANINNCLSFRTHAEESTTSEQNNAKVKILTTLNEIQNAGFDVLLQGLFQELKPLFKTFTQKKWVSCADIMDVIIAVTNHHISVFKGLKEPLYKALMGKIHLQLVQEHITRLLRKKVSLRSEELQNHLAELIQRNAHILDTFFAQNGSSATWLNSVLPSLAEIIRLQDINAIMVEVGVLASRYPDISRKHLSALLYIKGNLSSNELRSILNVLDIGVNATLPPALLFSKIKMS